MYWYVVSYDLRRDTSREAYERVAEALRTSTDWCKPLLSFWIVQTDLGAQALINRLLSMGAIDDNDAVAVMETTMRGNFCRLEHKTAIDWMNARITHI